MARRLSKADAVDHVVQAAVDFGASADAVTDGAARRLGLNRTDMRVLSLLRLRGPLAVGGVARHSGLSPAAATTVVRRLEKAGYVVPRPDPADGRRTVVSLSDAAHERLGEIYGPMLDRGRAWLGRLTVAELQTVAEVLRQAESLQLDLAAELTAAHLRMP